MRLQKLLVIAGLSIFAATALLNAQQVQVTMTLTVDNEYAIFAIDQYTGLLTFIDSDNDWFTTETYTFNAPVGSYIYVAGRDTSLVAMFVSKTVFTVGANSFTVLTGVTNNLTNWEVNERYRPNDFRLTDPNEVLNWGSDNWEAPAVGRRVFGPGDFRHNPDASDSHWPVLAGAYHIWKSPGGGNQHPDTWQQWGFSGHAGTYHSALFRLRVVPEPASFLALGVGLAGLVGLKRRKR